MMNRKQHLADSKEHRAYVNELEFKYSLSSRKRFRNWMKYPVSNTVYWWWGNVWHKPKMIWSVMTFGVVNHKESEADMAVISLQCKRCGWENPDSVIHAYPSLNEEFLKYMETHYVEPKEAQ